MTWPSDSRCWRMVAKWSAAGSSKDKLGYGAIRACRAARLAAGLALRAHPYHNSATTIEQIRTSALGAVVRYFAASREEVPHVRIEQVDHSITTTGGSGGWSGRTS